MPRRETEHILFMNRLKCFLYIIYNRFWIIVGLMGVEANQNIQMPMSYIYYLYYSQYMLYSKISILDKTKAMYRKI